FLVLIQFSRNAHTVSITAGGSAVVFFVLISLFLFSLGLNPKHTLVKSNLYILRIYSRNWGLNINAFVILGYRKAAGLARQCGSPVLPVFNQGCKTLRHTPKAPRYNIKCHNL